MDFDNDFMTDFNCGDMDYWTLRTKGCEICLKDNYLVSFFYLISFIPFTIVFSTWIVAKFIWMPYVEELKNQPELPEPEIEILYEEKYPLEKAEDDNKDLDTEICVVCENTPDGNVFMKYNKEYERFDYWTDNKQIEYKYLETVARKYVTVFACKSLYIDREQDIKEQIEKEKADKIAEEERQKKAEEQAEETSSDDDVFAKLKPPPQVKSKKPGIKAAINANKYKYKGKIKDFELSNKEEKPESPKKKMGFSDWKNMLIG